MLLPNLAERPLAQAQALFGKAFRLVLWSTLAMVAGLLLIDRVVLSLVFGLDFIPALSPLRLLYPGVLLLSLSKVLSSYILARGKPAINMWLAVIGVIINLTLNLLLIPRLGISGAAIASSFAYGAMFVGGLSWFLRQNQLATREFILFQPGDLQVVSAWFKNRLPGLWVGRKDV